MAKKNNSKNEGFLEQFSLAITKFSGSSSAFVIAFSVIILWSLMGPVFNYSEPWQLVINTTTTIVTFLMVFLIQRAQNKDSMSIQLKLNEIIASINGASNMLVDVEDLSEKELETLKKHYKKLAALFENEKNILQSHSIEEAENRHRFKIRKTK